MVGGGGQIIVPHHTNVCKFRDSDELYLRKFSTNLFKTWQFYLFKNFFFFRGVDGFSLTFQSKV